MEKSGVVLSKCVTIMLISDVPVVEEINKGSPLSIVTWFTVPLCV